MKIVGLLKNNKHMHLHLLRWFTYLDSLESTQQVVASLSAAKSSKARSNKTAASFALGLEGADMGKVVTRPPPNRAHTYAGSCHGGDDSHSRKCAKCKLSVRSIIPQPRTQRSSKTQFRKSSDFRQCQCASWRYNLAHERVCCIESQSNNTDILRQKYLHGERFHDMSTLKNGDRIDSTLKYGRTC